MTLPHPEAYRQVGFPKAEVPPEEFVRRQHAEAERLARLAPGEYLLWIDGRAAQLGVPRATLEAAVKAIIAQREKDERERKAEAERERRRAEKATAAKRKNKERAFKVLDALPEAEQEKRLDELARSLEEDPATVREEFAISSLSPVESKPELWPETVDSATLLTDLAKQIRRYVVIREFVELRRKLARWAADNAVALGDAKPEKPPGFHNRLAANWRLLFAIADLAGGAWAKGARQAAIKLSQQHAEPSQGRRLLAALQEIYMNRAEIPSAEIVQLLAADPDAEGCEYRGRTPITQRQLAVLLKEYEIYPVVLHPTKRLDVSRHGYRRAQFKDAFARFLPADPNIRTSGVR